MAAVGSDFRVRLQDRSGKLPATIAVEFRTLRQGSWEYDSRSFAGGGESVAVVWPNVQEPFEFRARGGDHHSMPWRRVETAPAPQVEAIRVTVHPPAYTGWSAQVVDEPVQIIAGSQLELQARTTRPIASGALGGEGP